MKYNYVSLLEIKRRAIKLINNYLSKERVRLDREVAYNKEKLMAVRRAKNMGDLQRINSTAGTFWKYKDAADLKNQYEKYYSKDLRLSILVLNNRIKKRQNAINDIKNISTLSTIIKITADNSGYLQSAIREAFSNNNSFGGVF
jgi:hypothetical protein